MVPSCICAYWQDVKQKESVTQCVLIKRELVSLDRMFIQSPVAFPGICSTRTFCLHKQCVLQLRIYAKHTWERLYFAAEVQHSWSLKWFNVFLSTSRIKNWDCYGAAEGAEMQPIIMNLSDNRWRPTAALNVLPQSHFLLWRIQPRSQEFELQGGWNRGNGCVTHPTKLKKTIWFSPYVQPSNPETEESERVSGGRCSDGLGLSTPGPWVHAPAKRNALLCVMLLVWAFKFG